MKHFSKQLSWLLAFVLIFTSLVSTGTTVYASDIFHLDENTQDVLLPTGTDVRSPHTTVICYYESADSDNIVYCDTRAYMVGTYDTSNMAVNTSAWRITYKEKVTLNDSSGSTACVFKAYPDTSIENLTVGSTMSFPEGTTLTTTGSAINVSIFVGDTLLRVDETAPSNYTLPSASDLTSLVGESEFTSALAAKDFHLPDLTKLYYTVEFTDKSTSPYRLKITLVPTVQVTFDANTGTPDLGGITRYATIKGPIDSTKHPTVSLADKDFYGWRYNDGSQYAYYANVANAYEHGFTPVSSPSQLKAMYQEKKPDFRLDLTNKKLTNLLENRTYTYSTYGDNISTDDNGEFSYGSIYYFEEWYDKLRLNSKDTSVCVNSDFVSLKHSTPNKPVVEYTATTARVTNTSEYIGVEFAIRATDNYDSLSWVNSSTFTGLSEQTEYIIYAKHNADEMGFESNESESVAFTTSAVKAVSNEVPNGVTLAAIPDQTHTGSAIEPSLVIKDGDKTLVLGTDYTVAYSNNTSVGTATATVTFKNDYSGTMTKNFDIVEYKLVSFDANGGTGSMSNVSILVGQQYTLPACTFTPPANKEFKAWNIGGTEYAAGAYCTITADTTVTAVWMDLEKVNTPAISPNGGTFSSSQTVTISSGTADAIIYYTTNGTEPTTGSTVYSTPFAISSSLTIKAIAVKDGMANSDIASANFTKSSSNSGGSTTPTYTPPSYTVTFITDGGSTIDSKSIKEGSTVGGLPAPTKDGFVFDGWYSDKELTKAYDVNTKITASTTLYAKWSKLEPKPDDNSKDNSSKNELVLTIGKKDAKAFGSDKTIESAPIIKNNRTMLPARFIAESLGAEVTWNGKKREVTIKGKNKKGEDVTILLYIDSEIAYVNGKKVKLDYPAFIENGRTFTPLRFVAEELGASVEWIAEEKKVVITK